jgi:hypothetical protein
MKKGLILLIATLIGSTVLAYSQSISPEVVATAGEHYQNGTSQLSWTLGEVMIDTYSANGNTLTQGFHQTQLTLTSIEETNPFTLDVNIFPNPTSQFLNIDISGKHENITASLYDMNGRLLMQEGLMKGQNSVKLDLSRLAMASYLLTVIDDNGDYSSTHQVNKTGR